MACIFPTGLGLTHNSSSGTTPCIGSSGSYFSPPPKRKPSDSRFELGGRRSSLLPECSGISSDSDLKRFLHNLTLIRSPLRFERLAFQVRAEAFNKYDSLWLSLHFFRQLV